MKSIDQHSLPLVRDDFVTFSVWLKLNHDGVTWQGRFENEFKLFWTYLFSEDVSLKCLMGRLTYLEVCIHEGPLCAWFNWLKKKLICFVFVVKKINLHDLSNYCDIDETDLGMILRNFFYDQFPHLEEVLNDMFHVSGKRKKNIYVSVSDLIGLVDIKKLHSPEFDDDAMSGLEVTLLKDWSRVLKIVKKNSPVILGNDLVDQTLLVKKWKSRCIFFRDLALILILSGSVLIGTKKINFWYIKTLASRISLLGPNDLPRDNFRGDLPSPHRRYDMESSIKIDDFSLSSGGKNKDDDEAPEERFETESEVYLSSEEDIPRDIESAEFEKSSYEEILKGGYRDEHFGRRKVYRVIMRAVDSSRARKELNSLIGRYDVEKASTVDPGTFVPGGIYYNLFVNDGVLKEFLAKVVAVDECSIYESRTTRKGPEGKNRVFIWIKGL